MMKNKIRILLIVAISIVSFSSCSDAIDIVQDGERNNPDDVYRNPEDVRRGLNGIYNSLPGEGEIEFVSVFTDEVALGINNGGQGLIGGEYGFFMLTGNAFASSTWGGYYGIINRINRLFEISEDLSEGLPSGEIAKLKAVEAELYALRAYAHFKLFAYFTPDYTNPSGQSIIISDRVPSKGFDEFLGRSTVEEVSQFIFDDLTRSDEARQDSGTGWSTEQFYVNSAFNNTVRLHLYSMLGSNPDEVIALGTQILNSPAFGVANASEYEEIFPSDTTDPSEETSPNKEIIFKLKRTVNGGGAVAAAWYSVDVSGTGSAFYEMGRSLYNDLDALDPSLQGHQLHDYNSQGQITDSYWRADVRYNVNIDEDTRVATNYQDLSPSQYRSADRLFIGKYQGRLGAALQNDIPVFRSADVLLAIAEARAAKGEFNTSASPEDIISDTTFPDVQSILFYLNFYRWTGANVDTPFPPAMNSPQEAYAAILKARRVELAFEGKRYLDMKRIGAKAGSPGFQRDDMDCAVNGACLLPISDYRMTLPIPASEINANPVIREQQNPGY